MPVAFHVLTTGYAHDRVASTVTLLTEDDTVAVVDPGMVADRRLILGPLAKLGIEPQEVTDVVFSHHHPDHTLNAALFPEARFHHHMAVYRDDIWEDRDADGYAISPSITLMTTPGHTPEDISTLATTDQGLVDEDQALLGPGAGRPLALPTTPFAPCRLTGGLPLGGEFFEQLAEVCAGHPGQGRMGAGRTGPGKPHNSPNP